MTAATLLAEVARRGAVLRPGAGGTILVRPRGTLPDELRAEIRARRAEVLALLSPPAAWPPCSACGRASGWKASAQDPTLRCLCGAPRPEPEADPRCVSCRAPLADPGNLLCPSCYLAKMAGKVRGGAPRFTGPPPGPVAPVGIERGAPAPAPGGAATATDGVRVAPPPAPEAQGDLFGPGEAQP